MTKKLSRLTCDNMEELVYLHEVWAQVWECEAVKKMRLEWFFSNQWTPLPSISTLVSCSLTLKLHLNDCDFDSRPLFLVSLFLFLYIHIHIYILLLLLYTIFPGTHKTGTGLSSGESVFEYQWHNRDTLQTPVHEPVCITSTMVIVKLAWFWEMCLCKYCFQNTFHTQDTVWPHSKWVLEVLTPSSLQTIIYFCSRMPRTRSVSSHAPTYNSVYVVARFWSHTTYNIKHESLQQSYRLFLTK